MLRVEKTRNRVWITPTGNIRVRLTNNEERYEVFTVSEALLMVHRLLTGVLKARK